MKRGILLFIIFISLVNFVHASYNCSVGNMSEDQETIALNEKVRINQLYLVLTSANDVPRNADFIIDVQEFSLTNQINSTEVELKSGDYTINLLSLIDDVAMLYVEGYADNINKGEIKTINNLIVYLESAEGTYPGNSTVIVEGIIGKEMISFLNEESEKIVEINDIDYLIELSGVSDTNAIIAVKKCNDESADFIKVQDAVSTPVENTTGTDNESGESVNETIGSNESSGEEDETGESSLMFVLIIIIIILIIVGLSLLLVRHLIQMNEERRNTGLGREQFSIR